MKRPLRPSLPSAHQADLEAIPVTISASKAGPALDVCQRAESKGSSFTLKISLEFIIKV